MTASRITANHYLFTYKAKHMHHTNAIYVTFHCQRKKNIFKKRINKSNISESIIQDYMQLKILNLLYVLLSLLFYGYVASIESSFYFSFDIQFKA